MLKYGIIASMKPITASVYTFSNLVGGGFVYVDKTAILRELIRPAFAQYFCARPRRFGKSLAISTLGFERKTESEGRQRWGKTHR